MNDNETVLMTKFEPGPPNRAAWDDPERLALMENYKAIIRDGLIPYPVAYRLNGELGRGCQGIVFKGYRHGARGCVTLHAIKLFDPGIYSSGERYWTDMGRIADQVCRLQRVNSPHLVGREIYEESNGIGYTQMDVIEGIDVYDLLYGNHMATVKSRCTSEEWVRYNDVIFRHDNGVRSIQPGVVYYIMRKALRGLEVLHHTGFLHGDIKPANLMIDRLGILKIVDFGRATRINEKVSILLGTPLYMAPETHRRENSLIQSDLYSLGLLGLELLRGKPLASPAITDDRELLKIKEKLPLRLDELLPPHVRQNQSFVALLRQFLDPDPTRRFASAVEAESMHQGLAILHQQLTKMGIDSQYDRDLQSYLRHLFPEQQQDFNYDALQACFT